MHKIIAQAEVISDVKTAFTKWQDASSKEEKAYALADLINLISKELGYENPIKITFASKTKEEEDYFEEKQYSKIVTKGSEPHTVLCKKILLGKGQSGKVRRVAIEGDPNSYVNKKVRLTEHSEDGLLDTLYEFVREVQNQEKLSQASPHVPRIKMIILTTNQKYPQRINIIMEERKGSNLEEYIKKHRLPYHVLPQLFSAVKACHNLHITLRDIKPLNIIFNREGKGTISLIDLGLSRDLSLMPPIPHHRAGTYEYMAPEALVKSHPDGVAHTVDLWALGITLMELFKIDLEPATAQIADYKEKCHPRTDLSKERRMQFYKEKAEIIAQRIKQIKKPPKNSVEYLIRKLLRADPKERASWKKIETIVAAILKKYD